VIAVAPSYRLPEKPGDHAHFREDALAAITWVVANIADYGGDPHRIFISGHSAGGNIAALLCLAQGWLPNALLDTHVRGVICVSGIYNLRQPFDEGWFGLQNKLFRHVNLLGARAAFTPGEPAVVINNSPCALLELTHLSGTVPRGFSTTEMADSATLCNAAINLTSLRRRPILVINAGPYL
jgi:alpha-beta hydrolase superfamily lysophospholipase